MLEAEFGQSAEADLVDSLRQSGGAVIALVGECDSRIVG
jgi:predicted N-acetyltransferase YhbS